MRKIILTFILLFAVNAVYLSAQSAALMQLAQTELQKRGLNESEVRARLIQEGINVESIAPAEYPNYQSRVIAILDKMQQEKSQAQTAQSVESKMAEKGDGNINITLQNPAGVASGVPSTVATAGTGGTVTDATPQPVTTAEEAAAEAQQRIIQTDAAKNTPSQAIYGHSLFTDKSLEIFRTTDGAEAPDTYVLGVGDEIRISIFGASQTDIQQRVAEDGSIQPTGVAKIFVKGLSLKQVRTLLRERLSYSYSFRPDQFAISIVAARTIMVNIFGEVNVTGSFNLSALNSAFNALAASGGPTAIGTVRNIQWIRGREKKTIDLYEFMNDPTKQFDFALQNNDILFVPVLENVINLSGSVKRPMQYELKKDETLADLIRLAGGLTVSAKRDYVQLSRFVNGEEKLFEYNLQEVLDGKVKVSMLNGDKVTVLRINKPLEAYVSISGAVYYPGQFDLDKNALLSKLIANAQPNFNAKTDLVFVERTRPDQTIEFLTVTFGQGKDFELQARDRVTVLDLQTYANQMQLSVVGAVRQPFNRTIAFSDQFSLAQVLDIAGGLKPTASTKGYISRRSWTNPEVVTYIAINLEEDVEMQLQAGDQLNVYDNTTFTDFGNIRVSGAVKNPVDLVFDSSLNLKDVLENTGGFNVGAAYNKVQVFRKEISTTEKIKTTELTLEVDSNFNLVKPANFQFHPYDHIVVRMTPQFDLGRSIEINGEVQYPGIYMIEYNETTLADVIKMAGGLMPSADRYGSTLFRTFRGRGNVTVDIRKAMTHSQSYRHNPVVFDGDVININRLENTVKILGEATRMAQYSVYPEQNEVRQVVYQGRKTARWYINEFAGGFQKMADRKSVTVTLPNNQTISTTKILGIHFYPVVRPGSTVSVLMDTEKQRELTEPKEKMDLETTLSKSLSMLMSTLSVILLMQRL